MARKFIEISVIVLFAIALILGIYWLIWALYCWVMPQIFTNASESVTRPNFWLFVGALFLLSIIGRVIFGGVGKST